MASGGTWKNEAGRLEAKLHLHWRLAEPTRDAADHERLREARTLAAELVGADKSATSSCIRCAGLVPGIARPICRASRELRDKSFSPKLNSAMRWSACARRVQRRRTPGNGHDRDDEGRDLKASLPELEAALGVMSNDAAWEEWNRVGMAAWVASNGQGFHAFNDWSKKCPKYNERSTKLRWNHYYQSPPSRIGAALSFILPPRLTLTGAAKSRSRSA